MRCFNISAFMVLSVFFSISITAADGILESQQTVNETKTMVLEARSSQKKIDLYGKIKSAKESILHAPVEGKIKKVHIIEGQTVQKGEPLLSIDTSRKEKLIQESQKNIKEYTELLAKNAQEQRKIEVQMLRDKHAYYLAEKHYAKQKDLRKKGIISTLQIEDSAYRKDEKKSLLLQTEYKKALSEDRNAVLQAKIDLAKTTEYIAKKDVEKNILRAPYTSKIKKVLIQSGQAVSSKDQLLEIYDNKHLFIRAVVAYGDVLNIKKILKIQPDSPITILINGQKILAQAVSLLPDSSKDFIGVDIVISANTSYEPTDDEEKSFTMWIADGKNLFDVPKEAVKDGNYVYKVDEENRIKGIFVKVVGRTENGVVIEGKGLKSKDRILLG